MSPKHFMYRVINKPGMDDSNRAEWQEEGKNGLVMFQNFAKLHLHLMQRKPIY